jgi:ribonuclease-3
MLVRGRKISFERLEKRLGYRFKNPDLLVRALTHSSFAHEKGLGPDADNELLEFLGDSVIGLFAAEFVFKAYPGLAEGELSKLRSSATNTSALADLARKIKLDRHLFLGKGEEKSGGRKKDSILADAFEALAAAVYLDGGHEAAGGFLTALFRKGLDKVQAPSFEVNNFKSALQEHLLKQGMGLPDYRVVKESGPPHKKRFEVEVACAGRPLASASGSSKKSAEQKAAAKAFRRLSGKKTLTLPRGNFVIKGRKPTES